jgi:hypothetical protein
MFYKILCFHGFGQTADIMKNKMKKVINQFNGIEFEFCDSLYDKSWYNLETKEGIVENMENINNLIKDKQYDGFIGFSQGAVFARIFTSIYNPNIKFIISLCGLDDVVYSIKKYTFPHFIKFYNVYGNRDLYVTPQESKFLTNFISNCEEIEFDGKHIIPNDNIINILEQIF